tara:strand:- start:758 stop:3259 length:2502 start_codon:yes stop_codon:yes gene_type:complete
MTFLKKHKKIIKNILSICIGIGILGAGIIVLWISTFQIPTLDSFNERKVTESTKIYDRTGEVLLYDLYQDIKRTIIPFDEISPYIKNATIAIEDDVFYEHNGVRPVAFLRAALANLMSMDFGQGGSTITQQVVKNSVLTKEKTITRKLKEWVLAVRLEQVLEKDDILNIYLNENPYGGSVYGVEEASQRFFATSASDISLAQAAYIAALPQAPTYYSPYGNHLDALENRKNLVLAKMLENNFITESEYEYALSEEVEFQPQSEYGIKAPHFVIYVRELLTEKYGEDAILNNGLTVRTTLNYEFQEIAEEIVKRNALENTENYNAENAALVAVDPETGEILTMVGSRDYFDEEIDGNFNIALAERQPGSVFKPFAYATAFSKGYTPDTILFDLKTQFSTACSVTNLEIEGDCYAPSNYDGTFHGPMSMRDALAQSVNVPAIKTLYLAGMKDTLNLAKNMGITTLGDIDQYGLTLVLGGGEVSLLDVVSAYGVFANEGVRVPYTAILEVTDKNGTVLEKYEPYGTQVLDTNVARQISDVLSDNVARTPAFGANSYLYFGNKDVAAKTGTTNDYRDAWIVGYTPHIAVGAWAGNNDNSAMEKRVAGFIIAPLWNEYMNAILPSLPEDYFTSPESVENPLAMQKPIIRGEWLGGISHLIDTSTGDLADDSTPIESLGEIRTGGVHSILHWVSKKDPNGPIPQNPNEDPQYRYWEYPVSRWVDTQGIDSATDADVPDSVSNAHRDENKPEGEFILLKNSYDSDETVTLRMRTESEFDIEKIEFYINSEYIGSSTRSPFSFSFVPHTIEGIRETNEVRAVIYDEVNNKTEVIDTLNVSL